MSNSSVSNDLRQGIESARAGHRLLARLHLSQAIDADSTNDAHWLWMAWVAESPAAAVDHLQRALDINPGNEIARAGLIWSKTMAEWDFGRSLSPRDTLAAVAEREAVVVPAYETPIAVAEREAEPPAEQTAFFEEPAAFEDLAQEPAAFAEEAAAEEQAAFAEEQAADEPAAFEQPQAVEEAPLADIHVDSVDITKEPTAQSRPKLPTDSFRPESIPIDQLTGMYMGEGKQFGDDSFAGFDMHAANVEVMQDPTASLATPFPGAMHLAGLPAKRPPSVELGTVMADDPQPSSDQSGVVEHTPSPSSHGDSDFETITPTAIGEAPAEPEAQAADEEANEEPTPSSVDHADVGEPAVAGPKPRKVMIVDDSPTVCKIVTITLKKRGFDVSSAADGVEAMALIASDRPDLILLDITMPRMDGYQLCKLIKGYPETKHIPVIMLSGKDGFFDRVRGKLVGCSDYITKPFDPELLVAAVERFLPAPVALAAT